MVARLGQAQDLPLHFTLVCRADICVPYEVARLGQAQDLPLHFTGLCSSRETEFSRKNSVSVC